MQRNALLTEFYDMIRKISIKYNGNIYNEDLYHDCVLDAVYELDKLLLKYPKTSKRTLRRFLYQHLKYYVYRRNKRYYNKVKQLVSIDEDMLDTIAGYTDTQYNITDVTELLAWVRFNLKDEILLKILDFTMDGLPREEIMSKLDISEKTYYRRVDDLKNFIKGIRLNEL